MTVKVRLLQASLRDRDRIFLFLAEMDRVAAYRALDLLAKGFDDIAEFPEIGRSSPNGYRCLVLRFGKGGYEIRYRVIGKRAVVTRIFHTREDRSV